LGLGVHSGLLGVSGGLIGVVHVILLGEVLLPAR